MKAALLSVDKVEFGKINVEANPDYTGEFLTELKKINYNYKGTKFYRSVSLGYPDEQANDPKVFSFTLNLTLKQDNQNEDIVLPYNIDVQATTYMRYGSNKHTGAELFTAVRATGYSILYGAIREMVSNLTARGPHGLWMLPAASFSEAALQEAEADEKDRLARLENNEPESPKKRSKKSSSRKSKEKNDT